MRLRNRQRKKARIEIIPMIDTMFFLLVFFMVATLSMTVMEGIPVTLPKATAENNKISEPFMVTITRDGDFYLEKEKLGPRELLSALKEGMGEDTLVIINADEEASHGKVVEAMGVIKLAGITRLAIATEPKDK